MASDGEDDEFDELFSFNASNNTSTTTPSTRARSSSPIDFGLDDDDDDEDTTTSTKIKKASNVTPASIADDLDDDDIFGSPPPVTTPSDDDAFLGIMDDDDDDDDDDNDGDKPSKTTTTTNNTAEELDFDDEDDEEDSTPLTPPPEEADLPPLRQRLPSQQDDDFHRHDAGTRDFLEWLDNDNNKSSETIHEHGGEGDKEDEEEEEEEDMVFVNDESAMTGGMQKSLASTEKRSSVDSQNFDFEKEILGESSPPRPKHSRIKSEDVSFANLDSGGNFDRIPLSRTISEPSKASLASASNMSSFGDFEDIDVDGDGTDGNKNAKESRDGENDGPTIASMPLPNRSDSNVSNHSSKSQKSHHSQHSQRSKESSSSIRAESPPPEQIQSKQPSFAEISTPPPTPPQDSPSLTSPPTISFSSLSEALQSPLSTPEQIRSLLKTEKYVVKPEERQHLWVKIICGGKTLESVLSSSIADSFVEWDQEFSLENEKEDEMDEITKWVKEEVENLAGQMVSVAFTTQKDEEDEDPAADEEEKEESETEKIAKAKRALCSVLLFHYRSGGAGLKQEEDEDDNSVKNAASRWDPLLPPLACTVLSSGMPPAAASVVLANIMPVSVPLMALSASERLLTAKSLHFKFYLLACYHFPLLVLHLDRYVPGWHWPKVLQTKTTSMVTKNEEEGGKENEEDGDGETVSTKETEDESTTVASEETTTPPTSPENPTKKGRNLESQGIIPMSWFVSHLAGECGSSSIPQNRLLPLWDVLLTNGDHSLKFFLALSILEKHSDTLLMLRGEELANALKMVMELKDVDELRGSFLSDGGDEEEENQHGSMDENDVVDDKFVQDWITRSKTLVESTPNSVVDKLRSAEDEAINKALVVRQKIAEEKLQARLEAEAKAHKEAMEAERTKKEEEARAALTRARLVIYYKQHNPQKVKNVDKILKRYEGRIDELDANLKSKYGPSFLPPVSHMTPIMLGAKTSNLLSSMNQGITTKKKQISKSVAARKARRQASLELQDMSCDLEVALKVSPEEIMPTLCSTKVSRLGGVVRGDKDGRVVMRGRYAVVDSADIAQLKFYLIDSRPDEAAKEQGRFPTSISLSPEALMDPDKVQQHIDMFESLRGAVHICVMGEGLSKFPSLYGHKLTDDEKAHAEDDEARTSMCALFFIKKGFPFVSILDGGFAAAHAWLSREGRERGLTKAANLVDYDEESSLFGQLETSYREQIEFKNSTGRVKAKLTAQKLLDNSMTRLTMTERRLESAASDLSSAEGRQKVKQSVSTFFASKSQGVSNNTDEEKKAAQNGEGDGPRFKNPFASLHQKRGENENVEGDSESGPESHAKSSDWSRVSFGLGSAEGTEQKSSMKINNPFAGDKNLFASLSKKDATTEEAKDADAKKEPKGETPTLPPRMGVSLKKNPFAGLSRKHVVPKESTDSETKKHQEGNGIDLPPKLGGPLKRNPFAQIGSKGASNKKIEGADPANKQKSGILRKNPFVHLGSKGSFETKESGADNSEDQKGGGKTDMNSVFKKNPFAKIGSKNSFEEKDAGKEGTSDQESGGKADIGSMLKRNPFASIGTKDANDDKKDTKAQNSATNQFGVFGLGGKDLYKSLSEPSKQNDAGAVALADSFGKMSFQGISARATSISKSESYSAQEESISFDDNYEENGDSENIVKERNAEEIPPKSSSDGGKDQLTNGITNQAPLPGLSEPVSEENDAGNAEPPALFPVFPVRNSVDPTLDLFDIGGLSDSVRSDATEETASGGN